MAASSEAAERRALLLCLGERGDANFALWQWCCSCLFEPERDALSFIFARTETAQVLASNRVLHSATPPEWLPPNIAEQLPGMRFKTAPRYLSIISDLSPGDAIVDWLERGVRRPDLVLLGSRGFTGLRRFLVGSVSSYVVEMELAPCLVVRSSWHAACGAEGGDIAAATARDEAGPAETPAAAARGRVVGIAVDGTPAGAALVQWCRQFLLRPSDSVSVLHGRPEKPKTDDELEAVDRAIEALNAAVEALHEVRGELAAPPRAELLEEGNVRERVAEWAESRRADVLVVGSRGLGGALKRAVLGSVSSYAVQHAACAVLVVSAPVLAALARGAARERADEQQEGADAARANEQQEGADAAAAAAEPQAGEQAAHM